MSHARTISRRLGVIWQNPDQSSAEALLKAVAIALRLNAPGSSKISTVVDLTVPGVELSCDHSND